VLQKIST